MQLIGLIAVAIVHARQWGERFYSAMVLEFCFVVCLCLIV